MSIHTVQDINTDFGKWDGITSVGWNLFLYVVQVEIEMIVMHTIQIYGLNQYDGCKNR